MLPHFPLAEMKVQEPYYKKVIFSYMYANN